MRNLVCRHCRAGLLLAALAMLTLLTLLPGHAHSQTAAPSSDAIWAVPEVGALPDDNQGRLVRHGRDLVTATYAHIGPEVSDPSKRYAGNNLACGNCHLEAGTKKFGLPIFGLYNEFPRYNARSGGEITIEEVCREYGTTTEGAFRQAAVNLNLDAVLDAGGMASEVRASLRSWRGTL